jgi:hypothetical protein
MGCCNKKNYILDHIENETKDFYFRIIRQEFIINQITEFNNKSFKNYYDFFNLTKQIGIHPNYSFQIDYWEIAYTTYSDYSLDGILFVFLFLCKADKLKILNYIKYYLRKNINHEKENDQDLVINLYEFKKILNVYFYCLTRVPLLAYLKQKTDENNENERKIRDKFSEDNIKLYTDYVISKHVKKNFYVNAGEFLEDKIDFLINDKLIRKTIYKFVSKNVDLAEEKEEYNSVKNNILDNEVNRLSVPTEHNPLNPKDKKLKKATTTCCSSRQLVNKNKTKIKVKDKSRNSVVSKTKKLI